MPATASSDTEPPPPPEPPPPWPGSWLSSEPVTSSPSLFWGGATSSATSTWAGRLPSSTTLSACTSALLMAPWLSTLTAARAVRVSTEAPLFTDTELPAPSTARRASCAPLPRVRLARSPERATSPSTWESATVRVAPWVETRRSRSSLAFFTVRLASPALGATSRLPDTAAPSTVISSAATSRMPSTS
mgnify:CR=1 FL=1